MSNDLNITVRAILEQFQARAVAQHMGTGAKRDRNALEFLMGAASTAHALGDSQLFNRLAFVATMVATRGAVEIETYLKAKEGAK